ncbi:MAG: hypothetical protein LCH84_06315 [Gemmatimonadetes bacterium]|nr:hypothetical protein [Gemmatimonadota bacterium]
MSIEKRVNQAFQAIVRGDPEEALFQICTAIEATAKLESGAGGKKSYMTWIERNIPVICAIGIGPALAGLRFGFAHRDLPPSKDGSHSLSEIVYHLMRCSLYHASGLPDHIRITENQIGPDDHGHLLIPKFLIVGLIYAVVASPANAGVATTTGHFVTVDGVRYNLDAQWGQRDKLVNTLVTARLEKERAENLSNPPESTSTTVRPSAPSGSDNEPGPS